MPKIASSYSEKNGGVCNKDGPRFRDKRGLYTVNCGKG